MKRISISIITVCSFILVSAIGNHTLAMGRHPATAFLRGSVGDMVWLDRDGDGLQDTGELGFAGMVVVLLDANGVKVADAVTDANGKYLFSDVDAGAAGRNYEVLFKLPDNYRFSRHTGSTADGQNSDADELTGRSGMFTVMPGQFNDAIDAGVINPVLGTLPLHTLDLSAELKDNSVKLKWLAENEMNTERFIIQQSTDGIYYSNIGVSAISGPVNIPTYYYYTADVSTLAGNTILYFRIRAEDDVNRTAYSNVIPVRQDKIAGIRVWPNPFINTLQISYSGTVNTQLDIQLTDNSGKTAWQGSVDITHGMNQHTLHGLSRLPAGIYLLRITDSTSGITYTQKLVK